MLERVTPVISADPNGHDVGNLTQVAQKASASGTELGKSGAILADEVFRCTCGAEMRLSGSCRIQRGSNMSCAQCGLPFVAYGPMLPDVAQQRDAALRELRRLRTMSGLFGALFGAKWSEIGAVVDRIAEERKRPYSLQIHRAPQG